MKDSSEDRDSLATSAASLRCREPRKRQKAHAEQQQRACHLHPRPRARHALVPKYRNARGGASCKHGNVSPTACQEFLSFPTTTLAIAETRNAHQVRAGGLIALRARRGRAGWGGAWQGRAWRDSAASRWRWLLSVSSLHRGVLCSSTSPVVGRRACRDCATGKEQSRTEGWGEGTSPSCG